MDNICGASRRLKAGRKPKVGIVFQHVHLLKWENQENGTLRLDE